MYFILTTFQNFQKVLRHTNKSSNTLFINIWSLQSTKILQNLQKFHKTYSYNYKFTPGLQRLSKVANWGRVDKTK